VRKGARDLSYAQPAPDGTPPPPPQHGAATGLTYEQRIGLSGALAQQPSPKQDCGAYFAARAFAAADLAAAADEARAPSLPVGSLWQCVSTAGIADEWPACVALCRGWPSSVDARWTPEGPSRLIVARPISLCVSESGVSTTSRPPVLRLSVFVGAEKPHSKADG
jgi:hypothetical protein